MSKRKQENNSRWAYSKVPVFYKEKIAPHNSILFQVIKEAYYRLETNWSEEKYIEYFSLPESSIPRGYRGTDADLVGQYCDLANEIIEFFSRHLIRYEDGTR